MGYKAAVQVLKSAEPLKAKVQRKCDLLNDSEAWTDQQQLQTIYHQVLVLDLEYALDRKVEQELWTLGFKNHISALQEQARDKKNPRRSESQALLAWCLESASGFYLTLLQELCTTFDLDLPFRRKGSTYGQLKYSNVSEQITVPQSSSCIYICQYCLVHLGDIARYRNQRKQAESFYKQAIIVSPTSGHPYNQLALLEASQGDKLSTVFQYVRGIAVKNPFPATATNLANTLSAIIDKNEPLTEIQSKMTVSEFTKLFLKAHGLLHSLIDLHQAEIAVKSLNSTLTALIATQSFTTDKLIKITIINMYALKHIVDSNSTKTSELTSDELTARELILDLIAGSLSAFLLPVYTLKADETILNYYALPAIKLIFYWIEKQPAILKETVFSSRLQIWPGLCKLLNNMQTYLIDFDDNKYTKYPLSEDRELQGFLPLADKFKDFDFKLQFEDISDKENKIRAKRIIKFGKWLTTVNINNTKLIISKDSPLKDNTITFEPGCIQPDPTDRLLEEMKSFNVCEKPLMKFKEKRGGILKPQGSLEKAREERETQANSDSVNNIELTSNASSSYVNNAYSKLEATKLKRAKQNVALQSIYKKMEENKQVKFSAEIADNEKDRLLLKSKPPIKLANPLHLNQSFRPQSAFTQNHSTFSNTSNDIPKDYFNTPSLIHSRPPNISAERHMAGAGNMMFSNNGLDSAPKPQFNMPNSVPQQQMMNQAPNQAPQMQQGGTIYNMPPSMNPFTMPVNSNPTYQKQQPMPPVPAPNQPSGTPFANNVWPPAPPQNTGGNGWNQNQPLSPQQVANFSTLTNQFGNGLGPNGLPNNTPKNNNFAPQGGVTIDYSKGMAFSNPWPPNMQQPNAMSNAMPNQGMMGYNNANPAMSMRQAMLNEGKNNIPGGMNNSIAPAINAMQNMNFPQNFPTMPNLTY